MGNRIARLSVLALMFVAAFALTLVPAACAPRATAAGSTDIVVSRPEPTGYPPAEPPAPDRRPIEQNPECWIADPGWPRCSDLEGADTDG